MNHIITIMHRHNNTLVWNEILKCACMYVDSCSFAYICVLLHLNADWNCFQSPKFTEIVFNHQNSDNFYCLRLNTCKWGTCTFFLHTIGIGCNLCGLVQSFLCFPPFQSEGMFLDLHNLTLATAGAAVRLTFADMLQKPTGTFFFFFKKKSTQQQLFRIENSFHRLSYLHWYSKINTKNKRAFLSTLSKQYCRSALAWWSKSVKNYYRSRKA